MFLVSVPYLTPKDRQVDVEDIAIAITRTFTKKLLRQLEKENKIYDLKIDIKCDKNLPYNGYNKSYVYVDSNLPFEYIAINTYLSRTRSEQLKSLYHEIEHARQSFAGLLESMSRDVKYSGDKRSKKGYWDHPVEVFARKNENKESTHYKYAIYLLKNKKNIQMKELLDVKHRYNY